MNQEMLKYAFKNSKKQICIRSPKENRFGNRSPDIEDLLGCNTPKFK